MKTAKPPPGAIEEAKRNPGGHVYEIAGDYKGKDSVPRYAIRGAWPVDPNGIISGDFIPNPAFRMPDHVLSSKGGRVVEIAGFDRADNHGSILYKLGRSGDFPKFLIADVERELYAQQPAAQILTVECHDKPEFLEAPGRHPTDPTRPTVAGLRAIFPLTVRVRNSDGKIWQLELRFVYDVSDLDDPQKRQANVHFSIESSNLVAIS